MKKSEYEEMGLEEPNKFHPYRVSQATQGLDILFQDRVILFHQLSELGIVASRHPDYNSIRGEINLKHGFATAITKNSMVGDTHFIQCIEKVRDILKGKEAGPKSTTKDYLEQKSYPDEIPEKLLRDRLVEWLTNNPLARRTDVKTEFAVGGIDRDTEKEPMRGKAKRREHWTPPSFSDAKRAAGKGAGGLGFIASAFRVCLACGW